MRNLIIVPLGFLLIFSALTRAESANILIVNSNQSVIRYNDVQLAFTQAMHSEVENANIQFIDLKTMPMTAKGLTKKIIKADPTLIYSIGSKAYQLTQRANIQEIPLLFSSVINWHRFKQTKQTFGISSELPSEMPLYLYRYFFPKVMRIAVVYSDRFQQQRVEELKKQAKNLNYSLVTIKVDSAEQVLPALAKHQQYFDALWLIADPVVLKSKSQLTAIFTAMDKQKKPIFAYHRSLANLGAVLAITADNHTIGKQVANLAKTIIEQRQPDSVVTPPLGTHIMLDINRANHYQLKLNEDALDSVNELID